MNTRQYTKVVRGYPWGQEVHLIKAVVEISIVPSMSQQTFEEPSDLALMCTKLKNITQYDVVHLTKKGYRKMAEFIKHILCNLCTPSPPCSGAVDTSRGNLY